MDEVSYLGQTIKLSKAYTDYDDYKDDPNNLPPAELPRIEHLMLHAKVAPRFNSRKELIQAIFALQFPGYGLTSLGETVQPDGSRLCACSIEIPNRNKDRYFVYRQTKETYDLIDDFVFGSDQSLIYRVSYAAETLTYRDNQGKIVRESKSTPARN